jgi:hypothetical protein
VRDNGTQLLFLKPLQLKYGSSLRTEQKVNKIFLSFELLTAVNIFSIYRVVEHKEIFCPEDGAADAWNLAAILPDYTSTHPRKL